MLNCLHQIGKKSVIPRFKIHVCNQGNIFFDKIERKLAKGNSVFVGVPLQLGVDFANPDYLHSVKQVFKIEQCVGIASG